MRDVFIKHLFIFNKQPVCSTLSFPSLTFILRQIPMDNFGFSLIVRIRLVVAPHMLLASFVAIENR